MDPGEKTEMLKLNLLVLSMGIAATASAQIVADGSLEQGTPNPSWEEFSSGFDSPICSEASCTGFFGGAQDGIYWAWFGGATQPDTSHLLQEVTIPAGAGPLTFWLNITAASGNGVDTLFLAIDDVELFRVLESDMPSYTGWTEVEVDITAFADGAAHALKFESSVTGPIRSNFYLDSVAIAGDSCAADFNNDGTVNTLDFLAFLNAFNAADPAADFNGDGTVNTLDFLAFLNAFNAGC